MSRIVPIATTAALAVGCGSLSMPRPRPDSPASELAAPGASLSAGDAVVRSALVNAAHAEKAFYDGHVQAYTSSLPSLQEEGLAVADADHVMVLHANATTFCLKGFGEGTTASWYYTSSGSRPGLTTTPC